MIKDIGENTRNVTRRAMGAWWTAFGAIAVCSYTLLSAEPDYLQRGSLAMVFQFLCWTTALVLLSWRQPTGQLRLSDPGALVLLWGFLYLIYPSIYSFQGGVFRYSIGFSLEMNILLLWLHGLFFLGFTIGYLCFCASSVDPVTKIDTKDLPSGWILFTLSLIPLFISVFTRVISGGGLLPDTTYGQATSGSYSNYMILRSTGGFSYLWYQIYSKIEFYLALMQGVGAGLILIQTVKKRQGRLRTYIFMALVFVFTLLSSTGRRTEVFLTVAIALIFLDIIIGPLSWRKFAPVALVGLAVFIFFGYFRNNRNLEEAYRLTLSEDQNSSLGEFTLMYTKELYMVSIIGTTGSEGIPYLVQSVLFIVPSQLYPGKFSFSPTYDLVTKAMIGNASYDQGIGAAGTMIGDGYRFWGTIGVFFWSIVLGSIFGLTKRWLSEEVRHGAQSLVLLKAALLAGLYGWTYNVIRTDLSEIIYIFFYDLFVPWLLLSRFLVLTKQYVWMKPLPIIKSQ